MGMSVGGRTMSESNLRDCPFCKEPIRLDATKCKHCGSGVMPAKPPHGGVCPYCKEAINPEAIKCKHCASFLVEPPSESHGKCGCVETSAVGSSGFAALASALPTGFDPSAVEGNGSLGPMPLETLCSNCRSVGGLGRIGGVGQRSCCRRAFVYDPVTKTYTQRWVCWFESCTPDAIEPPISLGF
jgi:hypothetical protein